MAEVKFVSIHDETAELKKEHLLDSEEVRDGRGRCTVDDKLEDNQTTWTSPSQINSLSNESSVGPFP